MSATDRCEAFAPTKVEEREQHYMRYYGQSLPFFSQLMLKLQDKPSDTREFLKSHLTQVTEESAFRKVELSLPVMGEGTKSSALFNVDYNRAKLKQELCPRKGSTAYILKAYAGEA